MSFEKEYYEFERFWNDQQYICDLNTEKIEITFQFLNREIHSILDAGCGNGVFTNLALERFPEKKIVGFDRSVTALKYVKAQKFIGSIDQIPFEDSSFDCVIAHDVIEHLPVGVYELAIDELARVAGKYIVIAVPYDEDLSENVSRCPSCKTIFNNNLHFRSFNKEAMKKLFHKHGFRCMEIKTCDRNSFFVGQRFYGNLFYPAWQKHFRSPICPLCGFKNPAEDVSSLPAGCTKPELRKSSTLSKLKAIPKLIWPKYSRDYEMVALFSKADIVEDQP